MASYNVTKYSRFWAVREATGELVCLCVYKRGAVEVAHRLSPSGPSSAYCLCEAPPEIGRQADRELSDGVRTASHPPRST